MVPTGNHHSRGRHRRPRPQRRGSVPRRRSVPRPTPGCEATVIALLSDEAAHRAPSSAPSRVTHSRRLRHTERFLRTLRAQGVAARVALFRPSTYHAYCFQEALDPQCPQSRTRYALLAASTASITYGGQPLAQLVETLRERAAQTADPARAARLLHRARSCQCRELSALAKAAHGPSHAALSVLAQILQAAGPGSHQLVCTAHLTQTPESESEPGPLSAVLHATVDPHDPAALVHREQALGAAALLAAAMTGRSPAGIVLRTTTERTQVLRGWQLRDGWPQPLTENQVLAIYGASPRASQPGGPHPAVRYRAGFDLTRPS